jgi:hypothetical protein
MRRRERPDDRGPIRPPAELLEPYVEDFVTGDEEPPFYMRCEDYLVELAGLRHLQAVSAFEHEHIGRKIDMTLAERRAWLLGGPVPRWRDLGSRA